MGPKAAPAPEAAPLQEGANVIYFRAALISEQFATVVMNLNCRVDIILDSALRLLAKDIEGRIVKVQAELANPDVPAPKSESEEGLRDAETIASEKKELLDRLVAIIDKLKEVSDLSSVELQDESSTSIGVQSLLVQNGVEALKPAHKYTVGVVEGEEFKAF